MGLGVNQGETLNEKLHTETVSVQSESPFNFFLL
jgi:hypothetical protein